MREADAQHLERHRYGRDGEQGRGSVEENRYGEVPRDRSRGEQRRHRAEDEAVDGESGKEGESNHVRFHLNGEGGGEATQSGRASHFTQVQTQFLRPEEVARAGHVERGNRGAYYPSQASGGLTSHWAPTTAQASVPTSSVPPVAPIPSAIPPPQTSSGVSPRSSSSSSSSGLGNAGTSFSLEKSGGESSLQSSSSSNVTPLHLHRPTSSPDTSSSAFAPPIPRPTSSSTSQYDSGTRVGTSSSAWTQGPFALRTSATSERGVVTGSTAPAGGASRPFPSGPSKVSTSPVNVSEPVGMPQRKVDSHSLGGGRLGLSTADGQSTDSLERPEETGTTTVVKGESDSGVAPGASRLTARPDTWPRGPPPSLPKEGRRGLSDGQGAHTTPSGVAEPLGEPPAPQDRPMRRSDLQASQRADNAEDKGQSATPAKPSDRAAAPLPLGASSRAEGHAMWSSAAASNAQTAKFSQAMPRQRVSWEGSLEEEATRRLTSSATATSRPLHPPTGVSSFSPRRREKASTSPVDMSGSISSDSSSSLSDSNFGHRAVQRLGEARASLSLTSSSSSPSIDDDVAAGLGETGWGSPLTSSTIESPSPRPTFRGREAWRVDIHTGGRMPSASTAAALATAAVEKVRRGGTGFSREVHLDASYSSGTSSIRTSSDVEGSAGPNSVSSSVLSASRSTENRTFPFAARSSASSEGLLPTDQVVRAALRSSDAVLRSGGRGLDASFASDPGRRRGNSRWQGVGGSSTSRPLPATPEVGESGPAPPPHLGSPGAEERTTMERK